MHSEVSNDEQVDESGNANKVCKAIYAKEMIKLNSANIEVMANGHNTTVMESGDSIFIESGSVYSFEGEKGINQGIIAKNKIQIENGDINFKVIARNSNIWK